MDLIKCSLDLNISILLVFLALEALTAHLANPTIFTDFDVSFTS